MNEIILAGCTSEPLMSYLKALGVFRLLVEQADTAAKLSWRGGCARLNTRLSREELCSFFLDRYAPTPIIAPWNGGSGFYGTSAALNDIADSSTPRLRRYRDTISRLRAFIPGNKPKDEEKDELLMRCRSELDDDVVPWLDVCYVLGENRASFFPLLGTGANDGRLDFTYNFMQRLPEVISLNAQDPPPENSAALLQASLFCDVLVPLAKGAIGQFNPGGVGGANGTQGSFDADSRVNAWDFLLMIEGTLLFAGSLARRQGTRSGARAIFPFAVESIAVGYGSASSSEEASNASRAEIWLPLWGQEFTLPEVRHLFAEGRAQLGRRQARNAVEFALAVNLLGISRGVSSFVRYGFLKRNGLAFLAAPLGQVRVQPRPLAQLLNDAALEDWLDRWRRACADKERTPIRYQSAIREIDRARFAFANRSEYGNDAVYLQNVLRTLGNAEKSLALGLRFARDKSLRPLQRLSAQWLQQADDGSVEFRLAAALAGIGADGALGPFRAYLEPVEFNPNLVWSPGSGSAVWSNRPLPANLAAVFRRRQLEAFRAGVNGVPLKSHYPARLPDVMAFLDGATDDHKLAELLWALPAIDWSDLPEQPQTQTVNDDPYIPFEFGVLRLLVHPVPLGGGARGWRVSPGSATTVHDGDVFQLLGRRQTWAVGQAVDCAARRLKSSGWLVNGYRNNRTCGKSLAIASAIDAERLLAAMLFPLSERDLTIIANSVLFPPLLEE